LTPSSHTTVHTVRYKEVSFKSNASFDFCLNNFSNQGIANILAH